MTDTTDGPFEDNVHGWFEGQIFKAYLIGGKEVVYDRHWDHSEGNRLARENHERFITWKAQRLLLGDDIKLTVPTKPKGE